MFLVPLLAALILPPVPGVATPQGCGQHAPRPPSSYTTALKIEQLHRYRRYRFDQNPHHYEEDHLVPLALGGHPTDPRNLWPQPWRQARADDVLEYRLYLDVCRTHTRTLRSAQHEMVVWKHVHG